MRQSWAILAQLVPSWGYFGSLFGPAGGCPGLVGDILSHLKGFLGLGTPRPEITVRGLFFVRSIWGPILGPKTGNFSVKFGVLCWTIFWTTFGAVWEAIFGSFLGEKWSQKIDLFGKALWEVSWLSWGSLGSPGVPDLL